MSENRSLRHAITSRLGLPNGFFKFDMKDTFRLVVWIIMAAFALGGLWAKNKADLAELRGADAATIDRIDREEKTRAALAHSVTDISIALGHKQEIDATIAASLEGIRTELRYVNDKIDVLRTDVRASRRPE